MKTQKIAAAAFLGTLLYASPVIAQEVHIGGFMDYTTTAVTQRFYKSSTDDGWDWSEPAAEYGSTFNGSTMLFMDVNALNFEFHTGAWLGSGLGAWYYDIPEYADLKEETKLVASNPIYSTSLTAHFLDDQLRLYTGNFAGNGWNAGFISTGWQIEHRVENLANRSGSDAAFTGVEIAPHALDGFRLVTGFPVAPVGVTRFEDYNNWSHLAKAVKIMAQFKWQLYNATFNAGFRPNTYRVSSYDSKVLAAVGEDHRTSLFSEAFAQVDLPSLIYGMQFLVTWDVRWREAKTTAKVNNRMLTSGQLLTFGMNVNRIPQWKFNGSVQLGYCDDSFAVINEREIFTVLAAEASHQLAGTPYSIGLKGQARYMQDTRGAFAAITDGNLYCDGWIGFETEYMRCAATPAGGEAGRYLGVYLFPYFQKDFQNGNIRTGAELLYTRFESASTTMALTYRVPVYVTFWF